jgi:hypothetical protein
MSLFQTALNMCQLALAARRQTPGAVLTREDIVDNVDQVLALAMFSRDVDREALIAALEQSFTIWSNDPTSLGNDDDHIPWLSQRRGSIDWRFWNRYRLYLIHNQKLAPAAVENIERVSEEVLGRIEDPERDGVWDRRGLVMGNVQSGKTGTYTGLICKAADAGYKVIIVLAGLHNNLRSQTQIRLDEGFLGYKAAPLGQGGAMFHATGVSEYGTSARADSVTNRRDNGDFMRAVANNFAIHPGGNPLLFVVKKNATVLRNLLGWINGSADSTDPETGRRYHREVPLLVIDDEADQASVDTKSGAFLENGERDEDHDPARINGLIRRLLMAFGRSAYVGFTATPFANIYIHEQARTRELGDDLFPRSFIVNLPAPSNYAGAARIFGIVEDEDAGLEVMEPLPVVRLLSDHAESLEPTETEGWMPPKLTRTVNHVPLHDGERRVPPSLRCALLSFLLSTTVRSIRETAPLFNSMLVHVVRFTAVQEIVREEVERELSDFTSRLINGDGARRPTVLEELESLWGSDFVPTTEAFGGSHVLPEWDSVVQHLPVIAQSIKVQAINGSARDALDYEAHRETGLNVIAIGGDKLSRGLTLEGLTVSYFLRCSRMYDTLMQMGRWFGYKESYLDVCRLYTTQDLYSWFQHIAAATEELRLEFDHMVQIGASPKEYGLKVRSHPLMLVTSVVKMRNGTELRLSYAGDISETILFDTGRPAAVNRDVARRFVARLGEPDSGSRTGGYTWLRRVGVEEILEFLREYQTHPEARRADARLLTSYIRQQNQQGELVEWTVRLASSSLASASDVSTLFGGLAVGTIKRDYFGEEIDGRYTVRRLVNPSDEACDLDEREVEMALEQTEADWRGSKRKNKSEKPPTSPSGSAVRRVRDKRRGVLILYPLDGVDARTGADPVIGIAVSFPASDTARPISYTVNNTFLGLGDYDEL